MDLALELKTIPTKIRSIRKEKGLTLEQLGKMVGCTKAYLSQLENGKTKPSLSMLNRISEALNVNVSNLFKTSKKISRQSWKLKKNERRTINYPDGKVVSQLLTRGVFQKKMQPLISKIKPGGSIDQSRTLKHPPGSEEFVLVLKGEIDFTLEDEIVNLREGDTLYFQGDMNHHWMNNGKKTAEVFFLWTPPVW